MIQCVVQCGLPKAYVIQCVVQCGLPKAYVIQCGPPPPPAEQIMTLALRLPMEKVEDERKLLGPILADVIKNRDGQGNPASDDPSEKHCCLKLLHDEANKISA